ncbi:hypothetical protein GNI_035760 [Gregarina niphandrodes]|uniref:Uncharacterized protein n=1 Tax=Gregarina niphandrodes TaxID=110365 RepID=A0A023BAR2_GRENI|nr:hypothetical protein GNI_035760 [Gregarina niphandrodes]EZG78471.1 hypothetical protein GNI_035760 [Gregarina niphandrodes]|eukprot:XP_011129286.1 hypothetical protein GNI_035760 [Gregarina niphandrodes]
MGSTSGQETEVNQTQVKETPQVNETQVNETGARDRERVSSDYAAYLLVQSSLTPKQWESMRKVTLASFANCNLAYVELASMISCLVQTPYGVVDAPVRIGIMHDMGVNGLTPKLSYWITGCLLQHAGVLIEDLVDFLVTKLGYNPVSGPDGRTILQCLRRPSTYHEYSKRGEKDCSRRKAIIMVRLDKLPTVSITEFGAMTPRSFDRLMKRPRKTSSSNTTEDTRDRLTAFLPQGAGRKWKPAEERSFPWIAQYWKMLKKTEYDALRSAVSVLPMERRRRWRAVGRLFPQQFDCKEWTMVVDDGEPRPVYIPTLAFQSLRRMDSNRDSDRDFAAYCMIHESLTDHQWKSLRTVNAASFDNCNLAFVELGAIISSFVEAPYGLLDMNSTQEVRMKLEAGRSSNRLRWWITGCLLQHCGASKDNLTNLCVTLGFKPSSKYPLRLECLAKYLMRPSRHIRRPNAHTTVRRRLLTQRLHGLPTISIEEFRNMDQQTLEVKLQREAVASRQVELGAMEADAMELDVDDPEAMDVDEPYVTMTEEMPEKSSTPVVRVATEKRCHVTESHGRFRDRRVSRNWRVRANRTDWNCWGRDCQPPPAKRITPNADMYSSCLPTGQLERIGDLEHAGGHNVFEDQEKTIMRPNERLSRLIMDLSTRTSIPHSEPQ